ncbi:MAG: Acg family FMN-binding oxidoreductase [Aestuariivirga sp.]|uniref:Acg family FMN-binding oxidoreductase n=1 Tax=Aestuariivirga sp. TaxID=2650926 RepID=UPI0038CFC0CD
MPSRRKLLVAGGTLAAAGAAAYMLTRGPGYDAATATLWSPRDAATFDGLVHYASLAANSHNAQAWRFAPTGGGVAILPDMTRALPVADPDHHHLFASLGCAAENLMLAAAAAGRSSALAYRPEEGGRIEIALGQNGEAGPLFEAILERQSTRSTYDGRPVPTADLAALEAAARVDGAEAMLITDAASIARVLDLILAANAVQVADPAFAAELKSWLRFNARAAIETGDGLYAACAGNPPLPSFLGGFIFNRLFTVASENDRYAKQVRSSAGLAVIHSAQDDPRHWVQAGRSCQRFALQAAALGIRQAHVNQAVEVVSIRTQLQALLGLGNRRPDMVLRFGYAPPMPRSMRRPAAEVIVS